LYTPVWIIASDDGDDDDDDVDNEMDLTTLVRNYYGIHHPVIAEMIQGHDDQMRERLVEGITSWAKGVQSETE
jgi:hypothetical protein